MAPSGVGVGEYTAMECGKVHGLGELLEERGEGDCRHFRGGSAAISANSGEALYRPGKSRIWVDSVYRMSQSAKVSQYLSFLGTPR